MGEKSKIRSGDKVRIRGTPATLAAELAGRTGRVTPETPDSMPEQQMIGMPATGEPCCVYFDELEHSCWFAPHLLELVEDAPAPSEDAAGAKAAQPAFAAKPGSILRLSSLTRTVSRFGRFLKRSFARLG
jgi:hypothetical protein